MTGWNNHYKEVCVWVLLSHFSTSEVVSVIQASSGIMLPEDGTADAGEHAYQAAQFQSCPLCSSNFGPRLGTDTWMRLVIMAGKPLWVKQCCLATSLRLAGVKLCLLCSASSNKALRQDLPWLLCEKENKPNLAGCGNFVCCCVWHTSKRPSHEQVRTDELLTPWEDC